jgi:UDP-N-acetyl-2-amino-2-deoxyglucuronate dehydrogenase
VKESVFKYGVGIFGIGDVAQEHINGYIKNPLTEIKALASRRKESAQAAKDRFNLDCDILDTYDQLIDRDDISFAEKPVAHTLDELRSLKSAYDKAKAQYNVKTIVGFIVEHYDQFLSMKSLIKKGGIGKIYFVETDYWYELGPLWTGWSWDPAPYTKKGGGSASLISGCHTIGLLMSIGGDIEEVFCYETRGSRKDFEYAPTYSSVVKFKNGAIGRTGASLEVKSPFFLNIIIHGTKGSIINDKFYSREFFSGQEDYQTFNCASIDLGDAYHHAFSAAVDAFVEDIVHDIDSGIRLDFGLKVHEVAFALMKSAETGRPVKLPLL